jgi:hypothetical protein
MITRMTCANLSKVEKNIITFLLQKVQNENTFLEFSQKLDEIPNIL